MSLKSKLKKSTAVLLIVSLAFMVISTVGQVLVRNGFGSIDISYHQKSLEAIGREITENTAQNGKEVDITFYEDPYSTFAFMVAKPGSATAENPAPCIIWNHGGWNTKEKATTIMIELARRGFVVVTPDIAGMGMSDASVAGASGGANGVNIAAEYAMSLSYVDENNIGVGGHSNGNRDSANAINIENASEHNANRIRSFVLLGSVGYLNAVQEIPADFTFGEIVGKYDEWDILSDDALDYTAGHTAMEQVARFDSEFELDRIPEGQFVGSDHTITEYNPDAVNGSALDKECKAAFWNPPQIHNQGTWSNEVLGYILTTYYAACGVPAGANYIPIDNQVHWWFTAFQILGFIGIMLFLFPVVSIVSEFKTFANLRRPVAEAGALPSIKAPENWISLLVTFIATTWFTYNYFDDLYVRGFSQVFDSTFAYSPVNPFIFFFIVFTLFSIVLTAALYVVKRFVIHRNDSGAVPNPFGLGVLQGGIGELARSLWFGIVVTLIWMIPVCIAFWGFQATFRVWELAIYPDTIAHLMLFATKYAPYFILFLIPFAIGNAGVRFKELPDWATALISGLSSSIGIVALAYVQYSSVVKTGSYYLSDYYGVMAGMVSLTTPPVLIYSSFAVRHAYKKTGNVWPTACACAIILGLLFFTYMSA